MIIDSKKEKGPMTAAIEIGRVCVKVSGRDAGKFCVITNIIDESFVEITGPKKLNGLKRRRCNINHLEVLPEKIEIGAKATDEDVEAAVKKAKFAEKFKQGIKIE